MNVQKAHTSLTFVIKNTDYLLAPSYRSLLDKILDRTNHLQSSGIHP
jgi:hypothetical protein